MHWDWNSLGPISVLLGVLGGGIGWVYDRWSKAVKAREDRMIELWKDRAAEARRDADAARRDASRWRRLAVSWHTQLIRADMDPDPPMDLGGDDL